MAQIDPVERKDLATLVAERIRHYILSGPFKPGDRLPPERELAGLLKVTRTTLREALKILQTLRFVTIRQGDGVRVSDYLRSANLEILADLLFRHGQPDQAILANILEARALFGKVVARLAASRRTKEHLQRYETLLKDLEAAKEDPTKVQSLDLCLFEVLAEATNNLVFIFVMNSIRPIYMRHREAFAFLYSDPQRVISGHKALLEALKDGNSNDAEKAVEMLVTTLKKEPKP